MGIIVIKGKGNTTGLEYKGFLRKYPTAELWTLNDNLLPETSVHFDVHNPVHHRDVLDCAYRMPAKYRNVKKVVLAESETLINKKEINFPMKELKEKVGSQSLWINCAPAFMVAYAILMGADKICTAGVDFLHSVEIRKGQLACVEGWLNYAKSLGIIHENTSRSLLFRGRGIASGDTSFQTILEKDEIYC